VSRKESGVFFREVWGETGLLDSKKCDSFVQKQLIIDYLVILTRR
jgi:hypothetical protein